MFVTLWYPGENSPRISRYLGISEAQASQDLSTGKQWQKNTQGGVNYVSVLIYLHISTFIHIHSLLDLSNVIFKSVSMEMILYLTSDVQSSLQVNDFNQKSNL